VNGRYYFRVGLPDYPASNRLTYLALEVQDNGELIVVASGVTLAGADVQDFLRWTRDEPSAGAADGFSAEKLS
jgi:hypothetical protein